MVTNKIYDVNIPMENFLEELEAIVSENPEIEFEIPVQVIYVTKEEANKISEELERDEEVEN